MAKKITMREIADRAKVSVGTVSHVVNGTKVREPGRQRVLGAIKSLGYQPSQLARGLKSQHTNMIRMIIPDITNPFFPAVAARRSLERASVAAQTARAELHR